MGLQSAHSGQLRCQTFTHQQHTVELVAPHSVCRLVSLKRQWWLVHHKVADTHTLVTRRWSHLIVHAEMLTCCDTISEKGHALGPNGTQNYFTAL